MKKILFVANVAKEHLLKFHIPSIKKFKENGWVVDVACSGEEDIPYCDTHFKTCWKRSPFSFKTVAGIRQLKKIIDLGGYDRIYCHTPVGGLVARMASKKARKSGVRVIYFAHGLHFYQGAPLLNWLLYYPVEKFLSKRTDAMILINREDYDLVRTKFTTCKAHLLNGIGADLERLSVENPEQTREQYRKELQLPPDATVLLYCSELLKNKNQTYLMRVLKKVLEKNANVYLLLVGVDHCNGAFVAYAKKIAVYDHVRFLGWRNDIANLYTTADICTPTSIREGLPINVVEAMYLKVPVVATNNRGHRTIIDNSKNGFLVGLDQEDLFAERILQLIDNRALKNQLIESAYADCEKYTSNKVLTEILRIVAEE